MMFDNMPNLEGANCIGLDTDLFYDDYVVGEGEEQYWSDVNDKYYTRYISTAPKQHTWLRRVCLTCPVVQECREYAISHELYGFWGGMTAIERQSERVLRGITLGGNND